MDGSFPFALTALPADPPTHQQARHQLWAEYDADIASGRFIPFSFPLAFLGPLVVLLYFVSTWERRSFRVWIRFLAWAINFASATSNILRVRARSLAIAYGVGLGNAWSIVWFTVILLINDGKEEFSRIERIGGATQTIPVSKHLVIGKPHLNRTDARHPEYSPSASKTNGEIVQHTTEGSTTPKYYVQYVPTESLIERTDWAFDLSTNFRGLTWNWRSTYLPSPPRAVIRYISKFDPAPRKDTGSDRSWPGERDDGRRRRFHAQNSTRATCLRRAGLRFIFGYVMIDVVKILIIHDPYFFGMTQWPAPTYFSYFFASSPILVESYRLIVAASGLYFVLQTVFSLAPLVFVGLLGEKLIGVRGEPWVYPDEWGPWTAVFERGLAGWWGVLWHQTFRAGFTAPSSWILQHLSVFGNGQEMSHADHRLHTTARLRDPKAQVFQLFIAFCLSGFLHSCGSYTAIGASRPRDAFMFFLLQPFGILLNILLLRILALDDQRNSWTLKWAGGAFNVVFIHAWFLLTAPLLFDDFVRTGVYLYEPVPVSFLRALGFGAKGDTWWCWNGPWLSIYRGEHWWQMGVGI